MLYLVGSHLIKPTKITNNMYKTFTTGSYIINISIPITDYIINNINGYSYEIDIFYANIIQP